MVNMWRYKEITATSHNDALKKFRKHLHKDNMTTGSLTTCKKRRNNVYVCNTHARFLKRRKK